MSYFLKLFCTLAIFILTHARKETVIMRDPAWFKVCNGAEVLELQPDTCSKGIWLNASTSLGCVCVNGIWILSDGYCDENAVLVVGKGHCFSITEKVRSIKLLGKEHDPYYPSIYTAPSTLDIFHEVSEIMTPIIDTDDSVVIGINPTNNARRIDDYVCLKAEKEAGKPVYVHRNGRRSVNQWRLNSGDCNFPEDFKYKIGFGEMMTKFKIISGGIAKGTCSLEKCAASDSVIPDSMGRSFAGGRTIPKLTNDGKLHYGRSIFANSQQVAAPFAVKPGSADEEKLKCLQNRADVTQDPEQYERETKEQTIRMLKAHLSYPLLEIPPVEPKLKEIEFLRWLVRIVLNTCPGVHLVYTPMIIHGFLRMFYWLIQETTEKFTYTDTTDPVQYQRILDNLQKCYKGTEEMEDFMDEDPITKCSEPFPVIQGEIQNSTNGAVVIVNASSVMPDHIKGDGRKYDMPMEWIWKVVTAGFYRCSHTFNDTGDLSFMMEKLQSLFNPQIIKRWHNSHDALKAYEYVFQRVKLHDELVFMDRCVAGVKNLSPLKDAGWILRPKVPVTENDLSQARSKRSSGENDLQKIWNGKGYCLNDALDPIRKLNVKTEGCPIK